MDKSVIEILNSAVGRFVLDAHTRKTVRKTVNGVLCVGPPGFENAYACIAALNAARMNMEYRGLGVLRVFKLSSADIKDKRSRNSEKAMREVMQQVKDAAPCVLFVDDADALFTQRSSDPDAQEYSGIMTEFLEGFNVLRIER